MDAPRPRARRLLPLLTALLAGAWCAVAGLAAAGKLEVRWRGAVPEEGPRAPEVPDAARVRPVKEADPFYELVGDQGHGFRYEGGLVECWIEVEIDGKKTVGDGLGKAIAAAARAGKSPIGDRASGYLAWSRRSEGNKEVWALGLNVLGEDGKPRLIHRTRFTPPQPRSAGKGEGESWWAMEGELGEGKEVALFTVMTFVDEGVKSAHRDVEVSAAEVTRGRVADDGGAGPGRRGWLFA